MQPPSSVSLYDRTEWTKYVTKQCKGRSVLDVGDDFTIAPWGGPRDHFQLDTQFPYRLVISPAPASLPPNRILSSCTGRPRNDNELTSTGVIPNQ